MIKLFITTLLALASFAATSNVPGPKGVFHSPDGLFSAQFPAEPTSTSESQLGGSRTIYSLAAGNYAVSVTVTNRENELAATDNEQSFLDAGLESIKDSMPDLVIDPDGVGRKPSSRGHLGIQLVGSVNGQRLKSRSFVAPHHIYTVTSVHASGDSVADVLTNIFMDSLEIHE